MIFGPGDHARGSSWSAIAAICASAAHDALIDITPGSAQSGHWPANFGHRRLRPASLARQAASFGPWPGCSQMCRPAQGPIAQKALTCAHAARPPNLSPEANE